ncbi:MAG: acyl-CoA thioesterase [Desulfobulbaceae bacterium A2]|nr:MAG: acyl-CoA thioesterase [Desulfobulbaceae bacterium A2]
MPCDDDGIPPCSVFSHVMMPFHANTAGNVHGGHIMKFIDDAAYVIATRHARSNTVTASIDRLDFHRPVHVGDLLTLKASLNHTGRSSMEIGVRVEAENLQSGAIRHIASAYLTFVALDSKGQPTPVPQLRAVGTAALRRQQEAVARCALRLKLASPTP